VLLGSLGLLAAVAIGAAIWAAALWVGALGHATETIDPAIIASLANQGIALAAPPTTSVPIGRDQAKAIAFREFPNGKPVSAEILAKVLVQPNPKFNCTCWVVSWELGTGLPPPGGPVGSKASAAQFNSWMRYHVTFIDAQSGKVEFALESYYPLQPSPK
jgi:hypothetical protein